MRKAVTATVVVVALTALSTVYLHRRGYLPVTNVVEQTPEIVLRLENVEIAGRCQGKKAWSLKARQAEVSRTRANTTLYDIRNGIIYEEEKPVAEVTAGRAIYNDIDRSLEVSGGLKVIAKDGVEISSQEARYDSRRDLLTCPGKVTVQSEKSMAVADSLAANLKTSEVDAKGLRMRVDLGELEEILEKQESGFQGKQ